MIDLRSENNYVLTILIVRKKFFIQLKSKNVFEIFVIEKKFVNKINQEIILLFIVVQ